MGEVAVNFKVLVSYLLYRIVALTIAVKLLSVNATELYKWEVDIGSGDGLVLSENQ